MVRSLRLVVALALLAPLAAAQNDTLAVQKGSTLTITGGEGVDDFLLDNVIVLAEGDAPLEGVPIAIMPRNGTTLNGTTDVANFTDVKKLIINLNGGADVIEIAGLDFAGLPLILHAGDGDDVVNFFESTLGAVKLFGDDGFDLFELDATTFGVTKITGGAGPLSVDFDSVEILGSLTVTGGPVADSLSWTGVTVEGVLKVSLLQGDDDVTVTDVDGNGDVKFTLSSGSNTFTDTDSHWNFGFSFTGGPDADTFHSTDSLYGESLKLRLNAGASNVLLSSVNQLLQVGDDLSITGGPDDDLLNFAASDLGAHLQVGDDTKIKLAAGDNKLFSIGDIDYGGDVSYSGGPDDDEISFNLNEVGDDVVASLSGGTNVLNFFDTIIDGDLTVKAGSGDDTVALDPESSVAGKETYSLGGGNNSSPAF